MKNIILHLKKTYAQIFLYPTLHIKERDVDYDDYWKEKRGKRIGSLSLWQRKRANIVLRCVEKENPVTFVDIGCGDGAVLKFLKEHLNISKATGVDVSDFALQKAKEFGIETVKVDISDVKNVEAIPVADYILLFEILEHIQDSELFLRDVMKKAKKGVFFSFPNTGFYAYRLRLLFGKFPMQWRVHPSEHLRFWTHRDLKWWLGAQGIENYKIFYYEGVPLLNKIIPSLFKKENK